MKLAKLPRPLRTALLSAVWNLSFGFFNILTAVTARSYWHLTLAAFFLLLGSARLSAAVYGNRHPAAVIKGTGAVIILLAVIVAGLMYLTINDLVNPVRNMILVIAQAAYAFTVLTAAIVNMIRARKQDDVQMIIIRNLSCAAVIGSMLSLERVMLGTFGDAHSLFTLQMEAATGAGAFVLLLLLAAGLFIRARRII